MRQVVLIHNNADDGGGYTVTVPSLPGCVSEGDTIDEAVTNIRDAIALYIEDLIADGEDVPQDVAPIQVALV